MTGEQKKVVFQYVENAQLVNACCPPTLELGNSKNKIRQINRGKKQEKIKHGRKESGHEIKKPNNHERYSAKKNIQIWDT